MCARPPAAERERERERGRDRCRAWVACPIAPRPPLMMARPAPDHTTLMCLSDGRAWCACARACVPPFPPTPCPPCAPSQEGDTPVELARVFGKWKVVEILEKAAATKGR